MKFTLALFLSFIVAPAIGQHTKYSFDLITEYGLQETDTSDVRKVYFLSNSSNDSIHAMVIEKTPKVFYVDFLNENGVRAGRLIDLADFQKSDSIEFDCENVRENKPSKIQKRPKASFFTSNDTLFGSRNYKQYTIPVDNGKIGQYQKVGIATYITPGGIRPSKFFALFEDAFCFEQTSFPGGRPQVIFINDKKTGNRVNIYRFITELSTSKTFVVPHCAVVNP